MKRSLIILTTSFLTPLFLFATETEPPRAPYPEPLRKVRHDCGLVMVRGGSEAIDAEREQTEHWIEHDHYVDLAQAERYLQIAKVSQAFTEKLLVALEELKESEQSSLSTWVHQNRPVVDRGHEFMPMMIAMGHSFLSDADEAEIQELFLTYLPIVVSIAAEEGEQRNKDLEDYDRLRAPYARKFRSILKRHAALRVSFEQAHGVIP